MEFARVLLYLMLLQLVLVFSSCEKKDETPPRVTILSPSEGTIYSVYDTVTATFEIVDETQVVSATAELVSSDLVPITSKVNLQSFNASVALVIDDKLLETGDYYVLISANDGNNVRRTYRKIKIVAIPKVRRGIYAATSNGSGHDVLWKIDSLFQNSETWIQPGQDLRKLCVNSRYDQLTFIGSFSTGIRAYDLQTGTLSWSDDVFNVSQTVRYQDLICSNELVYTTIYDREIRGYSLAGALVLNRPTEDSRPELIYTDEEFLLVEMNVVGGDQHLLDVYHAGTRAFLWQTDLFMDIVSISQLGGNEVLVFGNDANQARVFLYNIGQNSWWEPRQLPTGKVVEAVKLSQGTFAISHESGLFHYTYSPNYLNQIKSGILYQDIGFDEDHATIVAATGTMLEEMTMAGQTINMMSLGDSIVSFDIHYTR